MPKEDTVVVERLRNAGVVPIGKTNVPEFGMGSHTYNKVYGTTVNPYDLKKSAGGSSGGAGAALAAGMLPLANGSDLGGSLRNPGNFNNVVGFRPTVGLVPIAPSALPFVGFAVKGPMARSVDDTAYLLSVMAGSDPRDPGMLSIRPGGVQPGARSQPQGRARRVVPGPGRAAARPPSAIGSGSAARDLRGSRLRRRGRLPGSRGADEVFLTLRAWRSWMTSDRCSTRIAPR